MMYHVQAGIFLATSQAIIRAHTYRKKENIPHTLSIESHYILEKAMIGLGETYVAVSQLLAFYDAKYPTVSWKSGITFKIRRRKVHNKAIL